ncbi:dihydroxyacetone kinase subunit DhaL [Fictibacillus macauensis ZFHKF-1]|uniref:phosphoenolpyruvate--glycerone phosphotransferase n=1 Tax=Fictibacillus macauensis ZFHKF-1 TaxID=1196324 RepID=I8UJC4_9BACL|nr:dihydroxyacetone kinase subunit DhaL [Fictibacillus macauensis]EIT86955.1 dihydroxyacetone kinase subunit DhaL [Fictibacillus macauensis ZFHKF-1]
MTVTTEQFVNALRKGALAIISAKDELTDLDREIGDGDHGINMARGFQHVHEELASYEGTDIGEVCKAVGMTLIKTVGGASGPLVGTAFIKFASAWKEHGTLTHEQLTAGFQEACAGIAARGKSEVGQKTMLDVWVPFTEALATRQNVDETITQALQTCQALSAKKGRAAYFGDNAIGKQDPGAQSSALLLRPFAEVM